MSSRDDFVRQRQGDWQALERLLDSPRAATGREISELSMLYRQTASDLMHARGARYGHDLLAHLDALAARAHAALYGHGRHGWQVGWTLLWQDFPRRLRESAPFVWTAAVAFALPLGLGCAFAILDPGFAEAVLPPEQLEQMAQAYERDVSAGRAPGTNATMVGFYVWNNVGIAFRCFATGVFFGIGSLFFLTYNGLMIGTTVGHVITSGNAENILTFICGHGPFELGAIVIAGAAGLRIGHSLIATGEKTRLSSLREAAFASVPLVSGAAAMLLLAALIEAFWSPSTAPHGVKWTFSAVGTLLVAAFWGFAARGSKPGGASRTRERP